MTFNSIQIDIDVPRNEKSKTKSCFHLTLSQVVRPEVPHLPWRVITEQGLQDAGPLSMMDKLDDCQTWSYEDAGTEIQKYSKEECPQQVIGQRS